MMTIVKWAQFSS